MLTKISNLFLFLVKLGWVQANSREHVLNASERKILCLTLVTEQYYKNLYTLVNEALRLSKNILPLGFINVSCAFEGWLCSKAVRLVGAKITLDILENGNDSLGPFVANNLIEEHKISAVILNNYHSWFQNLTSKEELLKLEIDGVRVGDLIYDSFLRYKPAITVDFKDPFLSKLVIHCDLMIKRARKVLTEQNVECLFSPYSTYVHWGVWCRVALSLKIKVFVVGNVNEFIKPIEPDFLSHVKRHDRYKNLIQEFSPTNEQRKSIKEKIENRLTGKEVDSAVFYMKENPFAGKDSYSASSLSNHLVFMLHAFTDSPHVYRWMLFHDFYEWIFESLKWCEEHGIECAVKIHPSESSPEEVESLFKKHFKKTVIIRGDFSNSDLANANIKGIVTVHGTVCYEFAYLGVPVICAGDNPHVDFNFCYLPLTKDEYFKSLMHIPKFTDLNSVREEVVDFYYAHNMALSKGRITEKSSQELMNFLLKSKNEFDFSKKLLCEATKALNKEGF